MNEDKILEFLQVYKELDELCKQVLSSERGISQYIEELENEKKYALRIKILEEDYKRLKRLRWVRNQLVHDTDSFEKNLFDDKDVEWLKEFRKRIIQRKDSYALIYQAKNLNRDMKKSKVRMELANNEDDREQDNSIIAFVFAFLLAAVIIYFVLDMLFKL